MGKIQKRGRYVKKKEFVRYDLESKSPSTTRTFSGHVKNQKVPGHQRYPCSPTTPTADTVGGGTLRSTETVYESDKSCPSFRTLSWDEDLRRELERSETSGDDTFDPTRTPSYRVRALVRKTPDSTTLTSL